MILLLDDEGEYVENIVSELNKFDLKVELVSNVDDAFKFINESSSHLQAIVCDVMMPHGLSISAAESRENLTTGLRFAEMIREMGIEVPLVLMTNLDRDRAPIQEAAEKCSPCTVIHKREKWSFEIAETIRDLLRGGGHA
jgi:CheY-like chemotaxis protein